ncbi:adropin-like [Cebidichthys violaceus]|uniref:adropin-like n=1 Tax=Cebidichthys violaceus TaxID=271503 RepID=UPI0035CAEAED
MGLETAVQSTMEHELRMGLSVWAIIAIVCNSVVGVLILILFVILYKACKVPSHQEKVPGFTAVPEKRKKMPEQKYLLTAA